MNRQRAALVICPLAAAHDLAAQPLIGDRFELAKGLAAQGRLDEAESARRQASQAASLADDGTEGSKP